MPHSLIIGKLSKKVDVSIDSISGVDCSLNRPEPNPAIGFTPWRQRVISGL